MAGMGAAPADVRRRTNEPRRGEWVDLEPLGTEDYLGEPDPEWPEHVLRLWAGWRADPVSSQFSQSDLVAVWEFAARYDKLKPSEQRLRMDGFGFTPKGKRDLRWRNPGQLVAPAKGRQAARTSSDRRSRLAAV